MGVIAKVTAGGGTHYVSSSIFCICSTAAETAAKVATVVCDQNESTANIDFTRIKGMTIYVKFTYSNTAENPTLNVGGTGAASIKKYGTTAVGSATATSWKAGAVVSFTYDGTNWIINSGWGPSISISGSGNAVTDITSDNDTISVTRGSTFLTEHQTVKQDGITGATVNRFAICSTAAGTSQKEVSVTAGTFNLETGVRVSVKFNNANTADSPTLKVGSTAAKNIYHNGTQITIGGNKALLDGVCDFVYDGTNWHLVGSYNDDLPLLSKTFTGVIGVNTNNLAGCGLYYGTIMPTSYTDLWEIKYKIYVSAAGRDDSKQLSEVYISGYGNALLPQYIFNVIANGSYRPASYHELYRATQTGINNGYGHALGVGLHNSWNPITAANSRTIKIDILYCKNCEFNFYNEMKIYANIPGTGATNYTGNSEMNFSTAGLQETGDSNDVNYQNRIYYTSRKAAANIYRYQFCFYKNDHTLLPVNSVNNDTGTTKTLTTDSFDPFGGIYYFNSSGSVSAGNVVGNGIMYRQILADLRYSFNCGSNTLSGNTPLYIVASPQADGSAKLHSSPLTQTLPSTDDGLIYIYVGNTYLESSGTVYRIELSLDNPVYQYKNGGIQLFTRDAATVNGHTVATDVPSGAVFTDTTYTSKAEANGGTDVSLVTTGDKYKWNRNTSNTGTVIKVSTGAGLTGGDITTTGTLKVKLRSETALTNDSAAATETSGRVYPVAVDKSGYLAVNVPWENTHTITGVKGDSETNYRTGNVNLTAANIGAASSSHTHSYAGSSSSGGAATSANKLNTDAGGNFNPVYFSNGIPVASNGNIVPFVVGTGTTAGTWLGTITGVTEYYDGLLILYKIPIAGASTTTLDINNLGAKTCYINNTIKLTTHFPVNQPIFLVYSTSQNSGCWMCLDNYWANSDTIPQAYCGTGAAAADKAAAMTYYVATANQYLMVSMRYANTSQTALTLNINSTGAKPVYINGSASSTSNYTLPAGSFLVFYDGTNYYFRTDGYLYSKDKKVLTEEQMPILVNMGTISSLPVTKTVIGVTTDMVCAEAILGTPAAQSGDWTVSTDVANKVTVSGTVKANTSTTLELLLVPRTAVTATS